MERAQLRGWQASQRNRGAENELLRQFLRSTVRLEPYWQNYFSGFLFRYAVRRGRSTDTLYVTGNGY